MKTLLSRILILLSCIFLTYAAMLTVKRYIPQSLSFATDRLPVSQNKEGRILPMALIVENMNIRLPVISAEIDNGKWPESDRGVSYLADSGVPGEVGNSIFYGHNWPNILGNLSHIKTGEKITVIFSDNSQKDFVVARTAVVSPDQTYVLQPTGDKRITIYTCTGILDTKRFVVTAITT